MSGEGVRLLSEREGVLTFLALQNPHSWRSLGPRIARSPFPSVNPPISASFGNAQPANDRKKSRGFPPPPHDGFGFFLVCAQGTAAVDENRQLRTISVVNRPLVFRPHLTMGLAFSETRTFSHMPEQKARCLFGKQQFSF